MILFSAHGELAGRLPIDSAFHARDAEEEKALFDLANAGFLDQMNRHSSGTWSWNAGNSKADRALLMLLARFDLHLEVGQMSDETVWIAAAIQERGGDLRNAFSGSGFRPQDAIRTCLGESAEFYSSLFRPGDSSRRCGREALNKRTINPWEMLGFSPSQRALREDFNAAWQDFDSVPTPGAFDGEIDWTAIEALADGSTRWLPTQVCLGRYGERAACADRTWHTDSNGCAAGSTRRNALAQALLELVERDATGIWWYGGAQRPALSTSLFEGDPLGEALAVRKSMKQRVQLLDLTHDLEIPVVAAILRSADGSLAALGFGCHVDHMHAARSAYREMCQTELSIAFARRRVQQAGQSATMRDRRLLDWLLKASALSHLEADAAMPACPSPRMAGDHEHVVDVINDRLHRAGLEAYVLDLQRPDIGVPAVRAFVPGLCHFKPRLGFRRLIDVPRALRWRDATFGPNDLSTLPLLI